MTSSIHTLLAGWQAEAAASGHPPPPSYPHHDVPFERFIEDSRLVEPGDWFVARVRTNSDGHPFIQQALDRGATLIIAQRPAAEFGVKVPAGTVYWEVWDTAYVVAWLAAARYRFPGRELKVIGVTGTDGKTSVSNMLYAILQAAGWRTGLISTILAITGATSESTGLHVTTPEAPAVQALLRRMVDNRLEAVIVEATSIGLAQHRVTAVGFDAALLTNITHEHVNDHGSHEAYVAAKLRLFEMTAQRRAHGGLGVAIINRDDDNYKKVAAAAGGNALSYSLNQPADVIAADIKLTIAGADFKIFLPGKAMISISSPLPGRFNVANMLCAAAAAYGLGITPDVIKDGLESVSGISGRMEMIDEGQPFQVIVDFAHTPNALAEALAAARPLTAAKNGRLIAVFGSAGKRDVEKRRLMAEVAALHADITILTAEDPRTEPLEDILEMMAAGSRMRGGVEGETLWRVPDRGEAIYFALTLARPGDVVLICGKGHEQSMCFGITEYPWDDRDATRAALQAFLAGRPMVNLGLPTFK